MQTTLGPNSALHSRQDLRELRKHVAEAVELVRNFGMDDWDLRVVVKGILTDRVHMDRIVKPDLVIEDSLENGYM